MDKQKTRINLEISNELLLKLKEAAKQKELSYSAFIRLLIKQAVDGHN